METKHGLKAKHLIGGLVGAVAGFGLYLLSSGAPG